MIDLKAELRCILWVTDKLCMFSFHPGCAGCGCCVYVSPCLWVFVLIHGHTLYITLWVSLCKKVCVQGVIGSCVRPLRHACMCLQRGGLPPRQLPSICAKFHTPPHSPHMAPSGSPTPSSGYLKTYFPKLYLAHFVLERDSESLQKQLEPCGVKDKCIPRSALHLILCPFAPNLNNKLCKVQD